MKIYILSLLISMLVVLQSCSMKTPTEESQNNNQGRQEFALVIHGGSGTILKENMTPELEAEYHKVMKQALLAGYEILNNGGSSMNAVEATLIIMEDSPLFNAGKGAVFTNAGTNELDASVMDGKTKNAGAVGGVRRIKNPIKAAIAVMENSPHVFLTGQGADLFAKEQGIEWVDTSYFFTSSRWEALQNARLKEKTGGLSTEPASKMGTVGAVALDKDGNIAAGTSTGGMNNKRYGRIGDSPVIGAGTYADNSTCGVSSTGHGEYFIRFAIAFDIHARMKHGHEDLATAADSVIHTTLTDAGGTGGIVALDKNGNISMTFNTSGMYRGFILPDGKAETFIYKE